MQFDRVIVIPNSIKYTPKNMIGSSHLPGMRWCIELVLNVDDFSFADGVLEINDNIFLNKLIIDFQAKHGDEPHYFIISYNEWNVFYPDYAIDVYKKKYDDTEIYSINDWVIKGILE